MTSLTPGAQSLSTGSDYEEARPDPRQDSVRSSRLGSFINDEPKFDSLQGSSDSDSEVGGAAQSRPVVAVVWENLITESSVGWGKAKIRTLAGVSGFAEPRSVLAVVGPAKSGKSALVNAIAGRLARSTIVSGNLLVNGRSQAEASIQPTFFCASDEPLANVTVEQALIYTAMLQMPDKGTGELEAEVRTICQRLGLLNELSRSTNNLDVGTKRRLTVACQMICCTSLLVMHDTLLGIQEGDALAILRAVHDLAKDGCTAVVVCQQPTTDVCSFFSHAYVLSGGEVVYFGDTGHQAIGMLNSAGMPCPPLYSPIEQFMRLIDPSFEVYLQLAQTAVAAQEGDWNARFSSMMFKVLQASYQASQLAQENTQRAYTLATANYDPVTDDKKRVSSVGQWFTLCRRLVTQGLQGLPLYQARIFASVFITLVYGGSYFGLNYSWRGALERTTILFIVAAVLPALAIGTLPFYNNGVLVYVRERRKCKIGVFTHLMALFTLALPHLAAAAALSGVVLILMCKLNGDGVAWGYFITNAFLALMCTDAMMLAIAAIVSRAALQFPVAMFLLFIQALAMGFFPGADRGFNLPLGVVSFNSWSYKGLLRNEFAYRKSTAWGCPTDSRIPQLQGTCTLSTQQAWDLLSQGEILLLGSRWDAIYVLIGIYGFWSLLFAVALVLRTRAGRLTPGGSALRRPSASVEPARNSLLQSGTSTNSRAYNGHVESPV